MRASDEKREQIVNKFLLENFFKKFDPKAELVTDVARQVKGSDVVFKGYNVDVKAQTSYLNNPTDTFILEVSTLNRYGDPIEGWFIKGDSITDFYVFTWIPDADVDNKGNLIKVNKAEIIFIKKEALRNFMRIRASDKELLDVADAMRLYGTRHRRLDNDIHYTMSEQLQEKPVNLVMPKSLLHLLSIKHCIVSENSIENVDANVTG